MFSFLVNSVFTKLNPLIRPNFTSALSKYCNYYNSTSVKSVENQVLDNSETNAEYVVEAVNNEIKNNSCRTFAVVHVCGKQFKVTPGDSIIIEGYWPPDVGDSIRLNKVLCAGSKKFSLFGTPLVDPGVVNVFATVTEKSLSHTKVHFKKKRRKQYMRINFQRCQRTVLRINDVDIEELK